MVYQEEAQVQQIRSLLRETILAVDSEFGPDPISNPNLFNDIVVMIQELLLDEIVRFKHPAFVDEREWRLVARFDFRRTRPTTKSSSGSLFQFRSSGGYVVPFIQLKPTKGKIPLTSVRFGPSLDFNVMRAR